MGTTSMNSKVEIQFQTLLNLHKKDSLRVLIVEDDESQWPLWRYIFNCLPIKVHIDWEKSAEGAVSRIRDAFFDNNKYDLTISDIYLEGEETGYDLWNKYGEAVEHFIFVTGEDLTRYELYKKMDFGYPLLLKKPIAPSDGVKLLINKYDL